MERDTVHVVSLHCALCKKYEGHLQSLKNFNAAWITGSTNQKVSNILDNDGSGVHKAALARKRVEVARARGELVVQSSPIGCALSTLDLTTRARMGRIFDLCFMMAKESVAFAKYPSLLELEKRHGVDLGHAYTTADSAKLFTGFIAKSQRQSFFSTLYSCGTHLFSLLMDGTTDCGNKECELMVLVYCFKNDAVEEITSCTRYLSLHSPQHADASGLLDCVGDALSLFGVDSVLDQDSVLRVEGQPLLVGVGTDGATVNVAGQNGLRGQMQRALPWLFWSWCYAHRLELACKDACTSSLFSSVQDMLLHLYYLYEKSSKKSSDLAYIVEDLKQVFDLSQGGSRPIRSCGMRWITQA